MDKSAIFAVTCSHKFLDMYIDIIKAENEVWLSHYERGEPYTRMKASCLGPTRVFKLTSFVNGCSCSTNLLGWLSTNWSSSSLIISCLMTPYFFITVGSQMGGL